MLRICSALVLLLWAMPVWAGFSGPVRVIDGDTLEVGDVRVRLYGIDAPETDQPCQTEAGESWACGIWASREVRAKYQGRHAECVMMARDVYGRTVATCAVDGQDVGRALVADGVALAYRKYTMDYDADEKRAAIAGRGVHAGHMMHPSKYRRTRIRGDVARTEGCLIKGNISGGGKRIYHIPGQQHYEKTGIRPENGERWFCSEQAAQNAGWRRARR